MYHCPYSISPYPEGEVVQTVTYFFLRLSENVRRAVSKISLYVRYQREYNFYTNIRTHTVVLKGKVPPGGLFGREGPLSDQIFDAPQSQALALCR